MGCSQHPRQVLMLLINILGKVTKFMFRFLKIFYIQCLDISTWEPRLYMLECITLFHQTFNFAQPSLCVFFRLGDLRWSSPSVISSILKVSPSLKRSHFEHYVISILLQISILLLRSSIIYTPLKQCCLPSETQSVVTLKFYRLWDPNHQRTGLYWCFYFGIGWFSCFFVCQSISNFTTVL